MIVARRRKGLIVLAVGLALAGSLWLVFRASSDAPSRYNVVVVSACSLRPDRLGVYNPSVSLTPKIVEWAKGAYIVSNAIAEKPWQNFTYEASSVITREVLSSNGYVGFPKRQTGTQFIIPPTTQSASGEWYWSEKAILHYHESLDELEGAFLQQKRSPFYAFIHLKYMHYPYFDDVNMGQEEWARLQPTSRELLEKYRHHPESFDEKLPLIELLLNDFTLAQKKMKIKDEVLSVAGIVSDPMRAAKWRKHPDYEGDLNLAKELYDLKIERFDLIAEEVLTLFGSKKLQENTVVIFTGDHGEAFMEHGVLGHSVNVYDEMLRYPLMVKFPGGAVRGGRLDHQINHARMAEVVRGIVEGRVNADNFVEVMNEKSSEYLLSRNCANTMRSVRFRSEWKLIKNLESGKDELYNLKTDAMEQHNVIDSHADMAWRLEEYLIDHQETLQKTTFHENRASVCKTY